MPLPLAVLHVPSIAVSWLFFLILLCWRGRRVCHDSLVAITVQSMCAYRQQEVSCNVQQQLN